ncbi:MAG: HPF/RaiA family ribosome-associated protein [Thermodesulfobacteriota bacterium]|nr:HPF/RaiA family ribosome-associated protein [Thermodesulfobacteriota bacterium]
MDRHIEAFNITLLPEWEEKIDEEIDKIQKHHPGIVHHFRISLIGTKHHRLGLFEVHMVASVPKDTFAVKHKGEKVRPLIVSCFDVLDRQLREYNRKRQGMVKYHEGHPVGIVREILSGEGYGIIENPVGEDIYFHRNAVKDMAFNDLAEGDSVMYAEEMGEKGPQAIWVRRY